MLTVWRPTKFYDVTNLFVTRVVALKQIVGPNFDRGQGLGVLP